MIHCARIAAALACLALSSQYALAAPRSVKASYNVSMNGLALGTINEEFEAGAERYKAISDTKPRGLAALFQRQPLRFSSTGRVANDGLRPVQFEARRSAEAAADVSAQFDWEQSQLMLTHDGKTESLPLPAGTQDRLSIMYQFMYAPPQNASEVTVHMTNGRKLDNYRYRVTSGVELDTRIGRLKTVHLVKIARENGDPGHEVWLSPEHSYLPVKVAIVERDGARFEQVIEHLELRE